jgi:glycine/D-amino acid oxidase-like deaminating enzyme
MSVRVPLSSGFANGDVSFWYRSSGVPAPGPRLDGDLQADVAIVGAGYTGLWTAYYLKRARPSLRVVVLEQEFAGFGASGRNGGWLTGDLAGSHERYGAGARRLQREMYASIDEVIAVCEKESIDCDLVKGGVVNVARTPAQAARLRETVSSARSWGIEEPDLRLVDPSAHVRVSGALAASWSPHCARIQPAKLAQGLARVVRDLGVPVYERTPVTRIAPNPAVTPYGTVSAGHVIRATEGC